MNSIISFIFGIGVGYVTAFTFIMLFARYMNSGLKENMIKKAKEKWRKQ